MRRLVITIDGPSGSGKSTAARLLAKRLGYLYLDTGAMYRAAALNAIRSGVSLTDPKALTALARRTGVDLRRDRKGGIKVLLDGSDVTRAIRRPEISEAASQIATVAGLRRVLVAKQRGFGKGGGVVAEGRDTGTVVFPKADLKVYLTASLRERARRRLEQLKRQGHPVSFARILAQERARDRRDRGRAASPLAPAQGAIRIDNTRLQYSQVLDRIMDYVRSVPN